MMPKIFDAEAVRVLAGILVEAGLTEVEVDVGDVRIRLVKAPAPVMAAVAGYVPAAPTAAVSVIVAEPDHAEPDDAQHPGVIASPMVGIVYLMPEPGAEPFVTVGQQVAAGQTVCVIEAMKTFNQVKAAQAGTVLRILVASSDPVEYGQPLLIVV